MDREELEMTEEMTKEADRVWEDPQKVMRLLDLIFLCDAPDRKQVCS